VSASLKSTDVALPQLPVGWQLVTAAVRGGAWACPYTDFPLLHFQPGSWVRWSNELGGSTALAVSDGHALLAGGYGADADRLALVALYGKGNGNAAKILALWRLPLAPRAPQQGEHADVHAGHPWQQAMLLTGRGDTIHLIQDATWHRWWVSDALVATNSAANQL